MIWGVGSSHLLFRFAVMVPASALTLSVAGLLSLVAPTVAFDLSRFDNVCSNAMISYSLLKYII